MRILLLAIPLLLLALPTPVAAQGEALGVRVIEDPAGDVTLHNPAGAAVPASTDRNGYLDIRAVDVEEQPDGYFVHLWLGASPPDPRVAFLEEGFHRIHFTHHDMPYEVGMQFLQGEVAWLGSDPSGSGEYDILTELELTVDRAAGRLSAFVPRMLLADRDGAPPFPGRALSAFTAVGRGVGLTGGSIEGQELSPQVYQEDTAAAPAGASVPVRFGAAQLGDARLHSDRPFRASNGEAATFIFEIEAANLGSAERIYRLEATGVPAGWQVTFPQPQVRLGGTDSQPVPVLATVPFAHQHGRITSFIVEMRDVQDAGSVGRVELGLHYTDPAQPSGHHPDLYLHSRAPHEVGILFDVFLGGFSSPATMNTAIEDPKDDGVDVTGSWHGVGVDGRTTWQWMIPLSPHLQMGLDFDLLRQGTLSVPFGTTVALPAARLDGAVYAIEGSGLEGAAVDGFDILGIPLATLTSSGPVDLLPTAPHTFEAAIVPTGNGDYLPYEPERNLALVLNLTGGRPAGLSGVESPVLKPGGHLTLPLLEYADPVDDLFALVGGLDLLIAEGAERRAPPGGSAIVTLKAVGAAGHYEVRALGLEADWVHLPDGLHVGESGEGEAQLAIHVPADAVAGTVVDLVLEVTDGGDSVRSLARLRLTVDPEAEDQGALAPDGSGKDAPAPAAALLLLGLLATALRRRQKS